MKIITPYGTAELDDIDNYGLSDDAAAYLKQHKAAVELFFGDEIELSSEDVDELNYIQEIVEIVIIEGEFTEPERAFALASFLDIEINDISEIDSNNFKAECNEYYVLNEDEADEKALEMQKNLLDDIGVEGLNEWARNYVYETFVDTSWFDYIMKENNESYANDIKDESASDDIYVNRLHEEMVEKNIMSEPEWPDENDFTHEVEEFDEEEPEQSDFDDENEWQDAYTEWENNKTEFEEEQDRLVSEMEEEYERAKEDYKSELESEVENNIDDFVESLNSDYDDGLEYYKSNFGDEETNQVIKNNNLVDMDEVAEWLVKEDGRGMQLAGYDGNEHEVYITFKGEDYNFLIYKN